MKMDTDLVRQILLAVEEFPFDGSFHDVEIEGRTENEISYHVMLLHEAGLIEALDLSTLSGPCWNAYSERCRSAFRGDGDRDSELMPIAIPR